MLKATSRIALFLGIKKQPEIRVLIICMENMCRSPLVAALLMDALKQRGVSGKVEVESAGAAVSMVGSKPDQRIIGLAKQFGFPLIKHRSRQVNFGDFERYHFVFSVDQYVQQQILKRYGVHTPLFLSFMNDNEVMNIPDPYYGNASGFERVYTLSKSGVDNFVTYLFEHVLQPPLPIQE